MIPTKDSAPKLYAEYDYTDDQGQKIRGVGYYVLSEELGVLWDITYDAKEDSWAYYEPIFQQIQETVKPLYPTDPYVICHENQTTESFAMVKEGQEDTYCAQMTIWGWYCQPYP